MTQGFRALGLALLLLAGCGDSGEGGDSSGGDGGGGGGDGGGGGGAPPAKSDALFNEAEITDYHLTMAPADWQSIIADDRGDEYRHANLRWKGESLTDIAVRNSGHATRFPGNVKPSLKLKFNEFVQGQKFLGLKTLKLEGMLEGTMMRERLAYGIFRSLIPASPRTAHCRLYVNGEYRGVFLAEERVSDDLLDHRFGGDDGNLYRLMVEVPEAFAWRGPDGSDYIPRPFQPETNEVDGDHSVLPEMTDVLNFRTADLAAVIDVENLITFLALEIAIVSRDGLLRDDGPPQNHFMYHHPGLGRFVFIPWDLDQSLSTQRASFSIYHNFEKTRIASVIRENPALDARLREKIAQVIGATTHPDVLNPRIDAIYEQIRADVYADPYKDFTNEDFDRYPNYLKRVVKVRYDSIRAELGLP